MRPELLHEPFGALPAHILALKVLSETCGAFDALVPSTLRPLPAAISPALAETVLGPVTPAEDPRRRLARIFAELSYCSDFDSVSWEALVRLDPTYVELAVEHCYFVLAASGASGAAELARLCTSEETRRLALQTLDRLASVAGPSTESVDHLREALQ